jgi:hypothetical protein
VAKPNAVEVAQLFGRYVTTRREARDAAQLLCDSGAGTGIVSLGVEGFVAVISSAGYDIRLPWPMHGNQTGAGDALAAALARGLARHDPWPELLADAAAVSAAAVAVPVAGGVAVDIVGELRPGVVVEAPPTSSRAPGSPGARPPHSTSGSSGVPDNPRAAVAAGILKVNIGTALNAAFTAESGPGRPPLAVAVSHAGLASLGAMHGWIAGPSSPPPSPNRVSDLRIATPTATELPRLAGLPARQ